MAGPQDIEIKITDQAALDIRQLAEQLRVTPNELVTDALRLLRTVVDQGLYVESGRLTSDAPILYALSFWRELASLDGFGKIRVDTRQQGQVAFNLPERAFRKAR